MNISFNSGLTNLANPKVRRQKFGVGSLLFLVLFGAIFTGVGVLAIQSSKINPSWTRIPGKIVSSTSSISSGTNGSSGSTIYTPVISYTVDNKSYTVTSSQGSSSFPIVGEQREVAYNPSQPNQAKVVQGAGTNALLYAFPILGILCLILAPIAFARSLRRSKDINQLTKSGQKMQGILTDVQRNYGTNNSTTYKIVVSATDASGTVRSYVSDTLQGIGGLAMAEFRNTPIPVDVYVNPSNPDDYYVDVADIPGLTPQRISELLHSVTTGQPQTPAPTPAAQLSQPTPPTPPSPPAQP